MAGIGQSRSMTRERLTADEAETVHHHGADGQDRRWVKYWSYCRLNGLGIAYLRDADASKLPINRQPSTALYGALSVFPVIIRRHENVN